MKAWNGQDILDLYIAALAESSSITWEELQYEVDEARTQITLVQYLGDDGFQFRFETTVYGGKLPICQYVRVDHTGEMVLRRDWQWFTPDDILWNTFAEAVEYSRRVELTR